MTENDRKPSASEQSIPSSVNPDADPVSKNDNDNDTDDPFAVPHRPERQRVRKTDNMTENNPDEGTLLTFKLYARSVAWTTNIRSPWGEVLAVISAVLATPLIAVVCVCEGVFIYGKLIQEAFGK